MMDLDHEVFNEWYNIDTSKMFLTKDIAFAVFQAGLNHGRKEIEEKYANMESVATIDCGVLNWVDGKQVDTAELIIRPKD